LLDNPRPWVWPFMFEQASIQSSTAYATYPVYVARRPPPEAAKGIDHAAEGLISMLEGKNFGKAMLVIKEMEPSQT
jgi:hypothetical protein